MMATSPSLKREVNDFVLEQIHAFKQPADFTDSHLLEYHLRTSNHDAVPSTGSGCEDGRRANAC